MEGWIKIGRGLWGKYKYWRVLQFWGGIVGGGVFDERRRRKPVVIYSIGNQDSEGEREDCEKNEADSNGRSEEQNERKKGMRMERWKGARSWRESVRRIGCRETCWECLRREAARITAEAELVQNPLHPCSLSLLIPFPRQSKALLSFWDFFPKNSAFPSCLQSTIFLSLVRKVMQMFRVRGSFSCWEHSPSSSSSHSPSSSSVPGSSAQSSSSSSSISDSCSDSGKRTEAAAAAVD